MSALTTLSSEAPTRRKRWTRPEFHQLAEIGLLGTHRWELVHGEIVEIMPQNPPHSVAVRRVMIALISLFGAEYVIVQLPVVLSLQDEPEPDVAVTTGTATDYATQHPGPEDIRLLVEVSSTTLQDDLTTKASLYAHAGIPEYWVLDVENRRLYVHRNPTPTGWGEIRNLAETETIASLSNPQINISVLNFL